VDEKFLFAIGNILSIKSYQFEDGGESRDKIAIVLYCNESEAFILQALVTSKVKIPDELLNHGCTNSNNGLFSFYMFEACRNIGKDKCDKSFSFNKNTFVHIRNNVSKISITNYLKYLNNVEYLGRLLETEYIRLIKCITKSRLIPLRLKRDFEIMLKNIINIKY
jgi:hypothetical protein